MSLDLTFQAVEEAEPGETWQALFELHWPRYRSWFLQEGERARASHAESARMLDEHMPELGRRLVRLVRPAAA